MESKLEVRGGSRIGRSYLPSINLTWPFATLEATDKELTIRVPLLALRSPRSAINAIELYEGVFSEGVRIHHSLQPAGDLLE